MAYQKSKPEQTDKKANSQSDIKGNFEELDTFLNINHTPFGANQGKHIKVDFTKRTDHPETEADEMAIYNNDNKLYIKNHNTPLATAGFDISSFTAATTGSTTLPSGLKLNWGIGTFAATSATSNVVFHSAYGTACYTMTASPSSVPGGDVRDGFMAVTAIAVAGATLTRNNVYKGTAVNFRYLAIGI